VDFRVGDVFFTATHAVSADLLAGLGDGIGRAAEARELRAMAARAREAVGRTVDPATGRARDFDMRAGEWLDSATVGGFAPLVCGADGASYDALVSQLLGPSWCGHPALAHPVPPTVTPDSAAFVSRTYWRGPQWPVLVWLLTWSLRHHGRTEAAESIGRAGREQLGDLTFAEYYDSLSGQALGSQNQSWTAAVALAWTWGEGR
jgi:hypothetical protein